MTERAHFVIHLWGATRAVMRRKGLSERHLEQRQEHLAVLEGHAVDLPLLGDEHLAADRERPANRGNTA
jgi:hypothetical protein